MNKWIKILLGLILLLGIITFAWVSPAWGNFWNFRHAAWEFLKGGFFWMVAFLGLILITLGISGLRD